MLPPRLNKPRDAANGFHIVPQPPHTLGRTLSVANRKQRRDFDRSWNSPRLDRAAIRLQAFIRGVNRFPDDCTIYVDGAGAGKKKGPYAPGSNRVGRRARALEAPSS